MHSSTDGRAAIRQGRKKIGFTQCHPCQTNYADAAYQFTGRIRTPKVPKATKNPYVWRTTYPWGRGEELNTFEHLKTEKSTVEVSVSEANRTKCFVAAEKKEKFF